MEINERVTGHIMNGGREIRFTGVVLSAETGQPVEVVCDDGITRYANPANLVSEAHVVSVRGGRVHLGDPGSPTPFPLCNSASRNTGTRFRTAVNSVDCRECKGILERRRARIQREAQASSVAGYRVWPDGTSEPE